MFDPLNPAADPFIRIYTLIPRLDIEIGKCPLSAEYLDEVRKSALENPVDELIFVNGGEQDDDNRYCIRIKAEDHDGKLENIEVYIALARSVEESFCQIAIIDYSGAIPVYLGASISGYPFDCVDELDIVSLPAGKYVICPCGWHIVCKISKCDAVNEALEIGSYLNYVVHPLAEP